MPKKERSSVSIKKPSQEGKRAKKLKSREFGKEIEDIFAGRIDRKPEVAIPEKKETKAEIARKKRKRNELARKTTPDGNKRESRPAKRTPDGFNNNPKSRPRKRTADGLKVYTEEEIGCNKPNSGYTPLCPFNCDCCF